jgi:hypothetical protein
VEGLCAAGHQFKKLRPGIDRLVIPAELCVGMTEVVPRVAVVGIETQRFNEGLDRFAEATEAHQHEPDVVMNGRHARVQPRGFLIRRKRAIDLSEAVVEDVADFVMDSRTLRVQPLRFVELDYRVFRAAQRRQRDAEVQMSDGVLRLETDGSCERAECVGGPPHIVICATEPKMRPGQLRVNPEGLVEGVNRLVVLTLLRIAVALHHARFRRRGLRVGRLR